MEMKNKLLNYIENSGISVEDLSEELEMDIKKFQWDDRYDWNAQEFLQVCSYLNIEPMQIYTKKINSNE
jgi:hypothetical protein